MIPNWPTHAVSRRTTRGSKAQMTACQELHPDPWISAVDINRMQTPGDCDIRRDQIAASTDLQLPTGHPSITTPSYARPIFSPTTPSTRPRSATPPDSSSISPPNTSPRSLSLPQHTFPRPRFLTFTSDGHLFHRPSFATNPTPFAQPSAQSLQSPHTSPRTRRIKAGSLGAGTPLNHSG